MSEKKQDLRFAGAGRAQGGEYNSIHISGSGKITGSAVCDEDFKVSGSGSVDGSLTAKYVSISGSGTVRGELTAGDASVSGSASLGSARIAGELRVAGSARVHGQARANLLRVSGGFSCEEGVECETFVAHGSFQIKGLLNAEKIDIELDGYSSAAEIGGSEIRVIAKPQGFSLLRMLNLRGDARLTCEAIEGTKVELEYTRAQVVRGDDVRIGIGCVIDRVEHTGEVDISTGATVREVVKVAK